jgi:hypothetical protein
MLRGDLTLNLGVGVMVIIVAMSERGNVDVHSERDLKVVGHVARP